MIYFAIVFTYQNENSCAMVWKNMFHFLRRLLHCAVSSKQIRTIFPIWCTRLTRDAPFSKIGRRRNFSALRDWIGLTPCQTVSCSRSDLHRGRFPPQMPKLWSSKRQRIKSSHLLVHGQLTMKTIYVVYIEDPNELEPNHNDCHLWIAVVSNWISYLYLTRDLILKKKMHFPFVPRIPWHWVNLCRKF